MVIPNWWEVKVNQYQDSRVNLLTNTISWWLILCTYMECTYVEFIYDALLKVEVKPY